MKRILLSLLTIASVGATAVGLSSAFFSDTETSTDNTFQAGDIDISVNGDNPWSGSFHFIDVKPSDINYIRLLVRNVGSNPADIWITNHVTAIGDHTTTEPECDEAGGTWTGSTCLNPQTPNDALDAATRYDLQYWIFDTNPDVVPPLTPVFEEVIYTDADNVRLQPTIHSVPHFLNTLPAGQYMRIENSYHLDAETTNWAQDDNMTVQITVEARQVQ